MGGGIELAGSTLFLMSRVLSRAARMTFWMAGRQVDMINTVIDLQMPSFRRNTRGVIDVEIEPSETPKDEEVLAQFTPIELAFKYSAAAYEQQTLPLMEVVKIDTQAQLMSKAIVNVLQGTGCLMHKGRAVNAAKTYLEACTNHFKYHQTGNERYKKKALKYLADAQEYRRDLAGALEKENYAAAGN